MSAIVDIEPLMRGLYEEIQMGGETYSTQSVYKMIENETSKVEVFTKADMVAILEDLDLKIDEMYEPQFSKEGMDGFYWAQGLFKDLVQEEINVLKGEEDGCNN